MWPGAFVISFFLLDTVLTMICVFQAIHSIANPHISSTNVGHFIDSRISIAFTPPIHTFTHPWNPYSLLGLSGVVYHASSYAPFPPPRLLQCILFLCKPLANHCCQLVGHCAHVLWSFVYYYGGPVEFTCCPKARSGR